MPDAVRVKELAEENAKLKEELQATKEHLKNYTQHLPTKKNIMKRVKMIITRKITINYIIYI